MPDDAAAHKHRWILFAGCGAGLAAIAALFCLHPEGNSDLFWQLKAGELIVHDRALLAFDPFSFTALGNAWFNHEWLPEAIFFLVERTWGFAGLSLLSFGIGLALAAAIFLGTARPSGSPAVALLFTLAAFVLGAPRIGLLRPDLISFLLFALLLLILTGSEGRRPSFLWLVVPLLILWANIHSSVIIGPPIVILFLVVRMFGPRGDEETSLSPEFVAVLGCAVVLAPAVNPHTWRIYTFPFEHLSQRYSVAVTSDWAGLSWFPPHIDLAGWGLLALAAAVVLLLIRRRKEIPVAMAIVAVASAAAGFWMVRFLPYAAIALCFLLATLLGGLPPVSRRVSAMALLLPFLLLALLARTGPVLGIRIDGGRAHVLFGRPVGTGLDRESFPVEAVQFIRERRVHGRIFNDMAWGGYLIWVGFPEQRVFIDTRTPVYGDLFVQEYADALFNERVFESVVARYGITHVLYDTREILAPGGPLQFLVGNPHWVPLTHSEKAVLFARVDVPLE